MDSPLTQTIKNPQQKFLWKMFHTLRIHHYIKNILIFLPLLINLPILMADNIKTAVCVFLLFCVAASWGYIFNDLFDRSSDQKHFLKKYRPFASGQLSIAVGIILLILVGIILVIGVAFLPLPLILVLCAYLCLNILYSLYLKRLKYVDIFILTLFYLLRILAGAIIVHTISIWLFTFFFFLFLSLGALKRFCALQEMNSPQKFLFGLAYRYTDRTALQYLGIISSAITVLIFIFYMYSLEASLHHQHLALLWPVLIILSLWMHRNWHRALQGNITEDPVLFALQDKISWLALGLILLCVGVSVGGQ